jgi:hypothetical protein
MRIAISTQLVMNESPIAENIMMTVDHKLLATWRFVNHNTTPQPMRRNRAVPPAPAIPSII